jgi:hypothetical protein
MNLALLRQDLHHSSDCSCAVLFVAQSTTQVNDLASFGNSEYSWKAPQFLCKPATEKLHLVFKFHYKLPVLKQYNASPNS